MQHVKTAELRLDTRGGSLLTVLYLMKVEPKAYRWVSVNLKTGQHDVYFGCAADYFDESTAIKALRFHVESHPEMVGVDLTIKDVTPPPDVRAAKRIIDQAIHWDWNRDVEGTAAVVAQIIREETGIDKLVQASDTLLTAYVRIARLPKPPGLDVTFAGLMIELLKALEIAMKADFTNLIKVLTADTSKVQVYGTLPPGMKQ